MFLTHFLISLVSVTRFCLFKKKYIYIWLVRRNVYISCYTLYTPRNCSPRMCLCPHSKLLWVIFNCTVIFCFSNIFQLPLLITKNTCYIFSLFDQYINKCQRFDRWRMLLGESRSNLSRDKSHLETNTLAISPPPQFFFFKDLKSSRNITNPRKISFFFIFS